MTSRVGVQSGRRLKVLLADTVVELDSDDADPVDSVSDVVVGFGFGNVEIGVTVTVTTLTHVATAHSPSGLAFRPAWKNGGLHHLHCAAASRSSPNNNPANANTFMIGDFDQNLKLS